MTTTEISSPSGSSLSRRARAFWHSAQGPLIAIGGAILIGAVLMLLTGHNPIEAYWNMLLGAIAGPNLANLASTLARATPIVGMGISAAIAFRAGFANLGGEGQMVLGALTAALVGLYVPLPPPLCSFRSPSLPRWSSAACGRSFPRGRSSKSVSRFSSARSS